MGRPSNRLGVVDAAVRCLEPGRQLAMSDVAAEAGLSKSTIYKHFPGGPVALTDEALRLAFMRLRGVVARAEQRRSEGAYVDEFFLAVDQLPVGQGVPLMALLDSEAPRAAALRRRISKALNAEREEELFHGLETAWVCRFLIQIAALVAAGSPAPGKSRNRGSVGPSEAVQLFCFGTQVDSQKP